MTKFEYAVLTTTSQQRGGVFSKGNSETEIALSTTEGGNARLTDITTVDAIMELGLDGWELVTVTTKVAGGDYASIHYFKRPFTE